MKHYLRIFFVIMLSMITCDIYSGKTVEIDGIYYYLDETLRETNGQLYTHYIAEVSAHRLGSVIYQHYSGDIVIPETIIYEGQRYKVESIDDEAFYGSRINSIIIPNSVEYIGRRAFANCTELSNIIFPSSVKSIFDGAFRGCTGLTYVYVHPNTKLSEEEKWSFFEGCTNFNPFQRPNDATINITKTVIDTLKAEKMFEEIKTNLIATCQKVEARQQRCEELSEMIGKKTKNETDLDILSYAYYLYCQKNNFWDYINEKDKNVKKGKITSDVQKYLFNYKLFLTDSLWKIKEKIDKGWSKCVSKDKLSYKKISVLMPNAFYRGRRYKHEEEMDSMDVYQQRNGWEYLYSNNRTSKHDSYPQELNYYVYDAAPQYKVLYNKDRIECVYDENGALVYVPSLTRTNNSTELKDIKRAVYLRDYENNKYGIKSQPAHTQEYLKRILCQDNGFEKAGVAVMGTLYGAAFASMAATSMLSPLESYKIQNKAKQKVLEEALKYKDSIGEKYIDQLRDDHSDEFGYVYMIERISNVSFRIIYINERTLQPSHCAIVNYRTGNKPYTTEFKVTLTNIPSNIPPCN